MTRRYSLGDEGEAAYRRLEASLRLGPTSGRALVVSDSVDVRWAVRRRLGELMGVAVVRPGPEVVREVHAVVQAAHAGDEALVVWVEGEGGLGVESEAWRQACAVLNMGRDALGDAGGVSLVLAGPRGLDEQVAARAPDLASMIRPIVRLGTTLDVVESVAEGAYELDELRVRLRRRAVKQHQRHSLLGVLDGVPKPVVRLGDVYVAPDLGRTAVTIGEERSGYGLVPRGSTIGSSQLLEVVDPVVVASEGSIAALGWSPRAVVVLGEPASGKSMLC
ncbi:MAG: hypothetical protein KDK70_38935, partial [Myxococcales bacterium]|nr:hypothetical protein [Myxococcales bacterium]